MSTKPLNVSDVERDLLKSALNYLVSRCRAADGSSSGPATAHIAASAFTQRQAALLLAKINALESP